MFGFWKTIFGDKTNKQKSQGQQESGKSSDKREPTREEIKKQDRSKPPRFDTYPFHLKEKNGVVIPYTAWPQEIIPYLQKDMVHYEAGMIALAWKGCEESFEIMFKELHNKDYYRRRLVLVNMEYHDLFQDNIKRVLKEALLDGHELVVTLAVKLAAHYRVHGLHEELQIVMECWPDDLYIQKNCKMLLAMDSVYYADIIQRKEKNSGKRQIEEAIYKGSSQCILQERWSNPVFCQKYKYLMGCYFPNMSESDMYYKKYQPSHVKGWHVMNVCEVDREGTATVVSWGRTYTLKLEELKEECKFVYVKYEE